MSMTIAEQIKELRKKNGLSMRILADLADVRHTTISDIENNKHDPNKSTLDKIGKALGVKLKFVNK